MAPIKQLSSLQSLCLDQISRNALNFASACQRENINTCNRKFQRLASLIQSYVPYFLRLKLFHILLKMVSLYDLEESQAEVIVYLTKVLISSDVQSLNFSELIYAGSVSYEVLDSFENGISEVFPYLPNLVHLDLSTHKNEVSLPSSSYSILQSIGWSCPNLRILNLNNNNRVTDDCLRCLEPMKFHRGCPLLEEIYVQECSVTHDAIVWLLRTFPNLKKIGYGDMGTILFHFFRSFNTRRQRPQLNLTYIDNTESTWSRSDRKLIRLLSAMCPKVDHVKIRVCDEDCVDLYRISSLSKLELRFYTGIHHAIGSTALYYLRAEGRHLTSLTLYCNELLSHHVVAVASSCVGLRKLYLHCNKFETTQEFRMSSNKLEKLKVLSIRIGQHEMDRCDGAGPFVKYMMETAYELEEVYLLLICKWVDHNFVENLLSENTLPKLKIFIYDAPRRNRLIPVIEVNTETAFMIAETCRNISEIGNLISWQVFETCVDHLRERIRRRNYDVKVIYSTLNKLNTKYL